MISLGKLFILSMLGVFLSFHVNAKEPIRCGLNPTDWCAAPPGDPCGTHKTTAECKADNRCQGLPYLGESMEACLYDAQGYATNCPTVGCMSKCERLNPTQCAWVNSPCVLQDGFCRTKPNRKK